MGTLVHSRDHRTQLAESETPPPAAAADIDDPAAGKPIGRQAREPADALNRLFIDGSGVTERAERESIPLRIERTPGLLHLGLEARRVGQEHSGVLAQVHGLVLQVDQPLLDRPQGRVQPIQARESSGDLRKSRADPHGIPSLRNALLAEHKGSPLYDTDSMISPTPTDSGVDALQPSIRSAFAQS
jgi:hypothetical protein